MTSPWQYVPIGQYKKPLEPVSETAKAGLGALFTRMGRSKRNGGQVDLEAELSSAPDELLNRIAPPPVLEDATESLDQALNNLASRRESLSHRVVVGPPGSGTSSILRGLAERLKWRVVEPPSSDQILRGDKDWLAAFSRSQDSPVVLPCLERCYLRHYNGLTLARKLLETLSKGSFSCLLGCQSWAWSYLNESLGIDSILPSPLALQAFDAQCLQRWLSGLVMRDLSSSVFRQADDGRHVFPDEETDEQRPGKGGGREAEAPIFLKKLAARSFGIPFVAWAIWRQGLKVAAEEKVESEALKAAHADGRQTFWVGSWSQIELPAMPPNPTHRELSLLHTVLIHGELPFDLLPLVLDFSGRDMTRALTGLSIAGLLKEEEGRCRVTLLGYPVIRQYLEREGYLVDYF
jgi:hypothetical protein